MSASRKASETCGRNIPIPRPRNGRPRRDAALRAFVITLSKPVITNGAFLPM
jgi:hypothetical protein